MSDFFSESSAREEARRFSDFLAKAPPQAPGGWSVPEAFIAVLIGAVLSDGELAAVEQEELAALAHRSRALRSLSPSQLSEFGLMVAARLRDEPNALRQACAALPDDMRPSLFAHALDLVLADGELTGDEADFLNTLILNLDLDREDVRRITDIIVLKNRY
jgi:uncharacterized tellurite resistance protein B-like protein